MTREEIQAYYFSGHREVVITSKNVAPRWWGSNGAIVRILPVEMSPYLVDIKVDGIVLTVKGDEISPVCQIA